MKRLPLNKILIPTVLGIWGWVIWTYFAPVLSFSDSISSDPPLAYRISTLPTAKDTFSLSLSYLDPFLKTSTVINAYNIHQSMSVMAGAYQH